MKYSIALISFIFLLGCTKVGKNVTIKGRVLNPVTGEGIQDAEVKILKTAGGFNGGFKAIKTVKSNSDGSFEISKLSLEHCYVVCHTPLDVNYYQIGWEKKASVPLHDSFTISVKKGKTMHADYYAVPYAHIQLKIENVNCQGPADHFVLYAEGTEVDMSVNGVMIDKMGCYQYTAPSHSKIPMGKRYYRWEVTRSGVTNTYYDTLYFAENEYKTFEINY